MRIHYANFIKLVLALSVLTGCSENKREAESGLVELQPNRVASGTIAQVGEVDWYRLQVPDGNRVVGIRLTNNTYRADVDLLATVYELDVNGEKVRLYADHAPEDSQLPANVTINIGVAEPKDIYIAVRDLMDDESSGNPYYLSVDLSESNDGNETFADAALLQADDEATCRQDSIAYVGDLDSYTFDVAQNGVFQLLTTFSPFDGGTDVRLNIKLFDDSGNVIDTLYQGQGNDYSMVRYLTTGHYYALVEDYGRDDFDTASSFRICLNSVATTEAGDNDSAATANALTPSVPNTWAIAGSLDYDGDQDWYRVSPSALASGDFQVLDIRFDTAASEASSMIYRVEVRDAHNQTILSHDHQVGSSVYHTQIKVDAGDHFIQVTPSPDQVYASDLADGQTVGASYAASVQVLDVADAAEAGAANNTIDSAQALSETSTEVTGWSTGKIGYRGDADWYAVTTTTTDYKVLELFLETDTAGAIEYAASIMRDSVEKSMADMDGSDGPTSLQTSLLITPTESGAPVTYYVKVGDFQSDEGDAANEYRIRANVVTVPAAVPGDAAISGTVHYFGEADEQADATAETITLEHNSSTDKSYRVNTALLDFDGESPNPDIVRETADGLTTFTFPWVAGYVDHQGDQDWFRLDLEALRDSTDTEWYYDIQVEMHVGAPGSVVEYVWKLYRDRGQNGILVDGVTTTGDGFFASAGDTGTSLQPIDLTTPEGDEPFWANQDWQGAFYFSMSDFNYVGEAWPEDDWGYDVPYYFRVRLVYHPDVPRPE
jgi:hypothetical protein